MTYSEAHHRATQNYRKKNAALNLTIPVEQKERYQAEAEKRGLSLTKFICQCVDQVIDSDTGS